MFDVSMRRYDLADELREQDGCNFLGHTELEGAGQHYIEMGVFADDVDATIEFLEELLEGTEWRVDDYREYEGPYFYTPDEGEEEEGNIRLKKNTWNEHEV